GCTVQRDEAVLIGRTGIIDLIELVAATKFRTDGIPQQLHQLDAVFGVVAVRAAHILLQVGTQFRVLKIYGTGVEVNQSARQSLLNKVLDYRVEGRSKHLIG